MQTTALPAMAQASAASSPFPFVPVIAGICCIGLIDGGWYARRCSKNADAFFSSSRF
jgi:hypothetical protein